ncbi:MAG TPA: RagB/SusD family nutrient uptake outer membrane protein [Bacteroidales bacterium]|nr:RagB/SusD family nutrient uptake outer membrane protein [Bacteroidales bacterium]
MKLLIKTLIYLVGVGMLSTSCETGILDKQPLDQLATENFWTSEKDAELALAGVYNKASAWSTSTTICEFDCNTDNGIDRKINESPFSQGLLTPTLGVIKTYWNASYSHITACNYFLENIERIKDMDASKKSEMIAEVRFLRAFAYYNMSQYWGGVPLVTKILTMDEANSIPSSNKETIVNFVLSELNEITQDLPATRPSSEHGRIIRGAALAIKGRLLMSEKDWPAAATAYKEIIDLGVHNIDPDYMELFNGKKEQSSEIIFSRKYLGNEIGNTIQLYYRPNVDGGWHHMNPFQSLVDAYLCVDGKSIENSELYDPKNPVVKDGYYYRDPRLLYTIYYAGVSVINGKKYQGNPDSTSVEGDLFTYDAGMTGYCLRKYIDEEYKGDVYSGGSDVPIVRYAEVLLSYLECRIKNNDVITQELLDQTINQVRTRESVNMPAVNETDPVKLWEILKRERRVELAWEGLRFWDLIRWGEAKDILNGPFYGIKITDDPENYDRFRVGPNGHYYVTDLIFRESDLPWPFPQDELDINSSLEQKDNWK